MTAPPVLPGSPEPAPSPSMGEPTALQLGANRWKVALVSALAGATLLALALLWRFEPQGQIFFPRCTFHQVTGLLCPGCGGLRATHALLHGDLRSAWRLNPLFVALLPVGAYVVSAWAIQRMTGRRLPQPLEFRYLWVVVLVLILGFGIVRNG
jgi:hypothetical protein